MARYLDIHPDQPIPASYFNLIKQDEVSLLVDELDDE